MSIRVNDLNQAKGFGDFHICIIGIILFGIYNQTCHDDMKSASRHESKEELQSAEHKSSIRFWQEKDPIILCCCCLFAFMAGACV